MWLYDDDLFHCKTQSVYHAHQSKKSKTLIKINFLKYINRNLGCSYKAIIFIHMHLVGLEWVGLFLLMLYSFLPQAVISLNLSSTFLAGKAIGG